MKFKFKHWKSNEWKTTTSFKVLEKEMRKLGRGVQELIEIRIPCPHEVTFIEDGVKCCSICGEQLTSHKD